MGLFRKAASISTLGGVKYTSKREAETKRAIAEAKLLKAQRRATKRAARDERLLRVRQGQTGQGS